MTLKAGVCSVDITPEKPVFLVGYPHVPRMSTGVHDPLLATALCLADRQNAVIAIALDLLFIHHDTARECRAQIGRMTGIPPGHIMFTATHTHSGPVTAEIQSWRHEPVVPPPDREYMDSLCRRIVEAGVGAASQLAPAELAVGVGRVDGVGGNRLSRDGTRDPEVGVIAVRRVGADHPFAIQMVYSMHPTVLHEDTTLVSADFPAYTRRHLAERYPGVTVLYHNGPCGNLSPRYHVSGQTFAEAERLGRRLGAVVAGTVDALAPETFRSDIVVSAASHSLSLPVRQFPSVSQARAELEAARAEYERLKALGAGHGPVRTAECTVFGAEEVVALAEAQDQGMTASVACHYDPVEVQVLRIGDHCLAGFPGECFVEYGLELKRQCPGTFPVSLANGELQGYIPTPDATGYEGRLCFFKPESGVLLVSAAADTVRHLGGGVDLREYLAYCESLL